MRYLAIITLAAGILSTTISANAIRNPITEVNTWKSATGTISSFEPTRVDKRAQKHPKRPKFTKRPRPRPHRPHNRPKECTNTDLIKNGDFDRSVRGWNFLAGSSAQFFWVKNSQKRPAHSGSGQGYLFLNRGYSNFFLTTTIPAVEYGNTVTITAWMRYEAPADTSSCSLQFRSDEGDYFDLTPNWTKYSFQSAGTGRPKEIQIYGYCLSAPQPIIVYLDDISATACVPRRPNPECQVLQGSDNFLVNPGFECPNGISAWEGTSYYGDGNETIVQSSAKRGNPTHSGSGMAALVLDVTQLPYGGVAVYQRDINSDMTRKYIKASFWLSVDSTLKNVTGCLLNFGTNTGYYLIDVDVSKLTSKWTKFEVKDIEPTSYDSFQISISMCSSDPQPIFYLDDVYFGIDRSAPPLPPTTTPTPEPTPTPGPCTTTPTLVDPSFESQDISNWLFFDRSPNYDATFLVDLDSTYGPPHAGSGVGVLTFPTTGGAVQLLQQLFGLCDGQTYKATIWYYVPSGYDPSVCSFTLGIFARSDEVKAAAAGVWTKVELVFYYKLDGSSVYPYVYIGVWCENNSEMVVLVDDITFGPAPTCSVTPNISDGSFESGDLAIWDYGVSQGDETVAITSTKPRTGKKSAVYTFPTTSNGAGFGRDFDACVGAKYTFRYWYYVPKQYKGSRCWAYGYVYVTGENFSDDITEYDKWVEYSLDFVSGSVDGHIDFGVTCLNQLKKVVIYVDDVSITKR